ncbi:rubrerythrin [Chloroflexota bacterium]
MVSELEELIDAAIYKETASQAFYIAGQNNTQDYGARALMKELAEEEVQHTQGLKNLKERGLEEKLWHCDRVPDLMISEHIMGSSKLVRANLHDTFVFAVKREQQAIEFYTRMMWVTRDRVAKRLCHWLANEELKHKLKLETFYDDMFYGED